MRKIFVKDNKLEKIREKQGYNQKEFAVEVLDEHYTWYNPVENGKKSISRKKADSICNKLNKEFKDIFEFRSDDEGENGGKYTELTLAVPKEDKEDWEDIFSTIDQREILEMLKLYKERKKTTIPDLKEECNYDCVSIIQGWENVVKKGFNMLEKADDYWWGGRSYCFFN